MPPADATGPVARAGTSWASVGVLGGVGPLATAYFLQLVVRLTEAARDQDHVDMLVANHASIPDRTAFILGRSADDPGQVLARDAAMLAGLGVGFLVMPCNTAHRFTEQVADAAGDVPFVSAVECAVDAVVAGDRAGSAVGLLATEGTVAARVYQDAFAARGVTVIEPGATDQAIVTGIIYDQVKAGRPADAAALRGVARRLADRGAGAVVLACTELSVVAADHDLLADPLYVDSLDELARVTIRRAGRRVRERRLPAPACAA
ncbi:aspartate/glutamate racemase family protein [Myceligenerans crystallogenes]|uniref:Aspartate racemase n=1 Tax=Myceligenerans crystallogenes TaxID=316335 RepID=A0ABP4ZQN9_9MICO